MTDRPRTLDNFSLSIYLSIYLYLFESSITSQQQIIRFG